MDIEKVKKILDKARALESHYINDDLIGLSELAMELCQLCEAEQKDKVEKIFEEISPHIIGDFNRLWWIALKQEALK